MIDGLFLRAFETDRLTLRPLTWRDGVFFYRLLGSGVTRQYLGGRVPRRDRFGRFWTYLRGHPKVGIWAVGPKSAWQSVGLIEVSPHVDGRCYEVSYQFLPSSWGRGYGREAVEAVVAIALNSSGLDMLIAETQTANFRSRRLLKQLGFFSTGATGAARGVSGALCKAPN